MPERQSWRTADLLAMKAAGNELNEQQLQQLIKGITSGIVDHAQLGAFLMAVFVRGMTTSETVAMTKAMMSSGSVMEWPSEWKVGDKHSTGGVGDKVSLPLTPALAACGLKVPMISGRGLMHTGGTLDKMESIPGLSVLLNKGQLMEALDKVGCVIAGQTDNLVPADRRMYATRDVTATVSSVPLIVSSILSKKGAESLSALVMDVKFGSASFMKTRDEAKTLARALVGTMTAMGVNTTALITSMDHPIGRNIGNALEVKEALKCLHGGGPPDLIELVVELGGELLASSGLADNATRGGEKILEVIKNGAALNTFKEMIIMQGVSSSTASDLCDSPDSMSCLPVAECTTPLRVTQGGVIVGQEALTLAKVSMQLGAGRSRAGDPICHDVGIYLDKVLGERIEEGEVWATIHHRQSPALSAELIQTAQQALTVDPNIKPFETPKRVLEKVCHPC